MMKKGIVFGVICLLILTSVPMVSGDNLQLFSEKVKVDDKSTLTSLEKLIDNVNIECVGVIFLVDLLLAILNWPVFYTRTRVMNRNDEPIHIKQHITLATQDGSVLDDFDNDVSFPLTSNYMLSTLYFTRYDWQRYDYMRGRFDITLDLRIVEDGSGIKLVFHGFIFNIGSVIFNPKGEIIE